MVADGSIANTDCSLLLSAVGVRRPPGKTVYELNSNTVEANFSAFALWQLLPVEPRPGQIWFISTPQARTTNWDLILSDAHQLGVQVKPVDLADEEADDPQRFLEKLADVLPADSHIVLNVTEGLRHHAFLYYALALYLTAFRGVVIDGVWYCRLETKDPAASKPLIDLKPVLDLAYWFHAIRIFQQQGTANAIAVLLQDTERQLRELARRKDHDREIHDEANRFRNAVDALQFHAFAYACGLPLEVGKAGRRVAGALEGLSQSQAVRALPLASSLFQLMEREAKKTAFRGVTGQGEWKKEIQLTSDELLRQAELIEMYCKRDQLPLAAGLMREWAVSWLMYQQGKRTEWLGQRDRKPFEAQWGAWANLLKNESDRLRLGPEEKQLCDFWAKLSDELRNTFHHHGMRQEATEQVPRSWREVCDMWRSLKNGLTAAGGAPARALSWPKVGGGKGKLLICPVGMSPGVLYSAMHHVQPTRVLIVGSRQSVEAADEARKKASQQIGQTVEPFPLVLEDPYTGVAEFEELVKSARPWLCDADEVHVSLTGGTALMGVLVIELANTAARDYLRPVHRFVLVDKRPPEDQRANPWEVSEIFHLN